MRAFLSFVVVAVMAAFTSVAPAAACSKAKQNCTVTKIHVKSTHKASHHGKKHHYASHKQTSRKHATRKSSKKRHYANKSSGRHAYVGKASYYWQPQRVASGGWFNPNAMTAAHKTLPFGTKVRVTNRNNGRSVVVTINDRGPYIAGRIIDLSRAAAHAIKMQGSGVVPVSITVIGRG